MEKAKAALEAEKASGPVATPAPALPTPSPPKPLIEIAQPGLSDAEKKKLDELRKLKEANKLKKQEVKKDDDLGLPKMNAPSLPPV